MTCACAVSFESLTDPDLCGRCHEPIGADRPRDAHQITPVLPAGGAAHDHDTVPPTAVAPLAPTSGAVGCHTHQ